jgi:hypothetical protein
MRAFYFRIPARHDQVRVLDHLSASVLRQREMRVLCLPYFCVSFATRGYADLEGYLVDQDRAVG